MPTDTDTQTARAQRFRALHEGPDLLLLPNPWDAGSARLFEWLGYTALATTSGGFAATLARLGALGRGAGARRRDRSGHQPAGVGRPGERVRQRAGRRGRDDPAGRRGRA